MGDRTISHRRADCEVERRFLYLEPDAGDRFLTDLGTPPSAKPPPSTLKALRDSGIPRHEPILDDPVTTTTTGYR